MSKRKSEDLSFYYISCPSSPCCSPRYSPTSPPPSPPHSPPSVLFTEIGVEVEPLPKFGK